MRWMFVVTVLAACSGDTPPNVDANPAGPRCSKQLYDLCAEEHDCDSLVCQNFAADGFQVCSKGCVEGGPACEPDRTGAAGTCVSGVCKPSTPNMCHL